MRAQVRDSLSNWAAPGVDWVVVILDGCGCERGDLVGIREIPVLLSGHS
jgi:hypothetical protein